MSSSLRHLTLRASLEELIRLGDSYLAHRLICGEPLFLIFPRCIQERLANVFIV
jgi:hypothetical protein